MELATMRESGELLVFLKQYVELSSDLEQKIINEQLSKATLVHLEEIDLKELGFPMGPRKILMGVIHGLKQQQQQTSTAQQQQASTSLQQQVFTYQQVSTSQLQQASTFQQRASTFQEQASTSQQTNYQLQEQNMSALNIVTNQQLSVGCFQETVASIVDSGNGVRKPKIFDVECILNNVTRGGMQGASLVTKLKSGIFYTPSERKFFIRTVCKYLMKHCVKQDEPTVDERKELAKAIITTFPVLKDPSLPIGYEHFFDPKSFTGHIAYYIRSKRNRDSSVINRVYGQKKRLKHQSLLLESDEEVEVFLRQTKPTPSTVSTILEKMKLTIVQRRQWIDTTNPSATEIMRRWPRLCDVQRCLMDEFAYVVNKSASLKEKWLTAQPSIIDLAKSYDVEAIHNLLEKISDQYAEDEKMLISFMILPHLLVMPPQRGIKEPRPSATRVWTQMFFDTKVDTVAEGMEKAENEGLHQPVLMKIGGEFFIKIDHTCMKLLDIASFAEAIDCLLAVFYVFNLEYPWHLRAMYGFFEDLCGIKISVGKYSCISELKRKLQITHS